MGWVVAQSGTQREPDSDLGLILMIAAFSVIGLGGLVGAWRRSKRQQGIVAVARRAGLNYSEVDPFESSRFWFDLFQRGDGRGSENVLWRDTDDGHSYRAFDFWYFHEHRDSNGNVARNYHRYSCAVALVGSSWPDITVTHEGVVDKVSAALGGGDIDTESEEFNRLFRVSCADRRFVSALLSPEMIEVLLSTQGELSFQLKGRWLLVWARPVKPKLVPGLLAVAERFVAAIPRVVWELYPSAMVDEHGRPLPALDDPLTRLKNELAVADLHQRIDDENDPFAVLGRSPYDALREEDPDAVEYDLDGKPVATRAENPWGSGRPPPAS